MDLILWMDSQSDFNQKYTLIYCQINIISPLDMISHHPVRAKKATSLLLQRDNKENCNNNIQPQPPLHKLAKIRESFGDAMRAQEKIVSSIIVDPKEELRILDKHLKSEYTRQIKKDYSSDILLHLISKDTPLTDALSEHAITPSLRAKMVDWMIEVLSSYKMSEQSFFRSVKYMDRFFKNAPRKLQVSDLHLLGIVSMFTATKHEEIYPFKLNIIFDKICRKKFSKKEFIEMEEKILMSLDFQLQQVTVYDIIMHALSQFDFELEPNSLKYLHKVCLYLGKMAMHNTCLAWKSNSSVAAAVIFISLKTVEQVDASIQADGFLEQIAALTNVQVSQLLEVSQQLLDLAKGFHKEHPNLGNLKKFNNAQYQE